MALKRGIVEITKGKSRKEEERYFIQFSGTHMNAILLLILSSTFLVQGMLRYLELTNKVEFIAPWFALTLSALIFFVLSVVLITVNMSLSWLKGKRVINLITFIVFIIGVIIFLVSLVFLLTLI